MLPLRQLEAFHAVVINGSMTEAAKSLRISQPAVSRLVSTLEETVGFRLFKRMSGGLRPTPEASYLFDEVEKALAHLNHITRLAEDLQDLKMGHLRVACLPGFATSLLPRVLAQFLKSRPGLTLTLEPRAPNRIEEWVAARQFDVGLSEGFQENPAVVSEPILIRTVCVVPKKHKLSKKKSLTAADLRDVPMIVTNREHKIFLALKEQFRQAGVPLQISAETRQFAPACIMASEGLGVSVVSEIDAREYENEHLVVIPFYPIIPFEINVLFPAYMPRSIVTLEFVEAFKQSINSFRIDTG
ncbi:MAG: LysR family transcriptional regulator [Gammaproteobacteria bacterium]|nr:LysR family transcriptional regulator [Gammaproteobacteria bacterium]